MKKNWHQGLIVGVVASVFLLSGCQSTGGAKDQAVGAGIGAAIGCGVGALVTRDAKGCAVGAAIGGVVGFGAVTIAQYNATQVRSASADKRMYALTRPVNATQVKIRSGSASPKTVNRGGSVDIATDYSVLLPQGVADASVTESWQLRKDGKKVADLPAQTAKRGAGGWKANAEIKIPSNVPSGTYVIEHRVQSGNSYDTDESTFVVQG